MRLLYTLLAIMLSLLLAGCGGPSYTENAVLGKIPSAFIEMRKEINQLNVEMNEEVENNGDYRKARDRYNKKVEECTQNTVKAVQKDIENLIGKEIPFTMMYDDPYYYIESITVDNVQAKGIGESNATINMTMKVRAKQDIKDFIALPTLCYINMTNNDSTYIDKGTIDPFYRGQVSGYTMQTNFIKNKGLKGGELFNEEGSVISFWVAYYNFTDFKEIRFISRDQFKALK